MSSDDSQQFLLILTHLMALGGLYTACLLTKICSYQAIHRMSWIGQHDCVYKFAYLAITVLPGGEVRPMQVDLDGRGLQ